ALKTCRKVLVLPATEQAPVGLIQRGDANACGREAVAVLLLVHHSVKRGSHSFAMPNGPTHSIPTHLDCSPVSRRLSAWEGKRLWLRQSDQPFGLSPHK